MLFLHFITSLWVAFDTAPETSVLGCVQSQKIPEVGEVVLNRSPSMLLKELL